MSDWLANSPEFQNEIARFFGVEKIEIVIDPNWGSHFPPHRMMIRAEVAVRTEGVEDDRDSSVSHTEGLGGFALLHRGFGQLHQVGFDIEKSDRVTEQIARRICESDDEFKRAPSAAALWCAKEAAFKSLRDLDQPLVIPEIEIGSWEIKSRYETFVFSRRPGSESLKCLGLTWRDSVYQFAIAVAVPSF